MTRTHGGERSGSSCEGTLATCSYDIKEDIFLTSGLYSLAVLPCFEYTANSVWGVLSFIFFTTSF